MKTKIIIGITLWVIAWYFIGKYAGTYRTEHRQSTPIILKGSFESVNNQKIEIINKTSELLIEKNVGKGVVMYLITIGAFYFFEKGYNTTYKPFIISTVLRTGVS